MNRTPRSRKCAVCSEAFQPARPLQKVCGPTCSASWAKKLAERAKAKDAREARAAHRAARERIKTRSEHMREAQAAFNAWVRQRDAGKPCLACKRFHKGQTHAGHYRSVGSCPELRFEPDNVHLVCQPCNVHLSGNLIEMRKGMIDKIGIERVEWIEGQHEPKKYTIEQLKEIKAYYRAEARRLKSMASAD